MAWSCAKETIRNNFICSYWLFGRTRHETWLGRKISSYVFWLLQIDHPRSYNDRWQKSSIAHTTRLQQQTYFYCAFDGVGQAVDVDAIHGRVRQDVGLDSLYCCWLWMAGSEERFPVAWPLNLNTRDRAKIVIVVMRKWNKTRGVVRWERRYHAFLHLITLKRGCDLTDVLARRRFALLVKSLQWSSGKSCRRMLPYTIWSSLPFYLVWERRSHTSFFSTTTLNKTRQHWQQTTESCLGNRSPIARDGSATRHRLLRQQTASDEITK